MKRRRIKVNRKKRESRSRFSKYKDGGTVKIRFNNKNYYRSKKIGMEHTHGKWFKSYDDISLSINCNSLLSELLEKQYRKLIK